MLNASITNRYKNASNNVAKSCAKLQNISAI